MSRSVIWVAVDHRASARCNEVLASFNSADGNVGNEPCMCARRDIACVA